MTIAALLGDLAIVQPTTPQKWGYKQAAAAIRALPEPIEDFVQPDGTLRRIPRIGPSSARIIFEVLRTGGSPTVERAVQASPRAADVMARRELRGDFLSAAAAQSVLADRRLSGPSLADYRGDLQMHSTWSDGSQTLETIVRTGLARGYDYAAVTDHSAGLRIARGLTHDRFLAQHRAIDRVNEQAIGDFRLLKGVEANIDARGDLDVEPSQRAAFDIVVAAPHAALRRTDLQTERMVTAVTANGIHILGHPRGRMYGSRAGILADWRQVFDAAQRAGVAIELDGDPSRQDLDFVLAREALDCGCLLALDSDAHSASEWSYAETALAHARLAGVPVDRIINCWPLERLLEWARARSRR